MICHLEVSYWLSAPHMILCMFSDNVSTHDIWKEKDVAVLLFKVMECSLGGKLCFSEDPLQPQISELKRKWAEWVVEWRLKVSRMEREEDRPNKTVKNDLLRLDWTGPHDTIWMTLQSMWQAATNRDKHSKRVGGTERNRAGKQMSFRFPLKYWFYCHRRKNGRCPRTINHCTV